MQGYGPASYKGELQSLLDTMRSQGLKTQGQIIAPSVNRDWSPEDVFNTGFLNDFVQELGVISVEKYANTARVLITHQSNLFAQVSN